MTRHCSSLFELLPYVSSSSDDSSGTKLAVENNGADSNSSKRSNKIASADSGSDDEKNMERDSNKKRSASRLFSKEDQLAILKGHADFITKTGKDPMEDTRAFYNFVKDYIHANASKEQLMRKVFTMRSKFESNTYEDFTKEHDHKAFELFQKIEFKKLTTSEKGSGSGSVLKKVETVKDLEKGLCFVEICIFSDALRLPLSAMEMELMEESNIGDLKERWEKTQIAQMKVVMTRTKMVRDQLSEMVEASYTRNLLGFCHILDMLCYYQKNNT